MGLAKMVVLQTRSRWSDTLALDETEPASAVFKGRHFEAEIIVVCVRWYLRFGLSRRSA